LLLKTSAIPETLSETLKQHPAKFKSKMKNLQTSIKLLLGIIFFYHSSFSQSQKFQRTYTTVGAFSAVIESNTSQSYYIAGKRGFNSTQWNPFIMKLNLAGDAIWAKHYDCGIRQDELYDIKELPNGYLIAAGVEYGNGTDLLNFNLMKLDSAGNLLWRKAYRRTYNEYCYSFELTPDNGFILVGLSTDSGSTNSKGLIIKTDSLGQMLWAKNIKPIGGSNNIKKIIKLNNGNYVCMGAWYTSPSTYLFEMDTAGTVIWLNTYQGAAGNYLAVAPDNGFIVSGSHSTNGFLLKVDSIGNFQWSNEYIQTSNSANNYAITNGRNHTYVFEGMNNDGNNTTHDLTITKVDSVGNIIWSNSYGPNINNVNGTAIIRTADSTYFALGGPYSGFVQQGILVKINDSGNSGCLQDAETLQVAPLTITIAPGSYLDSVITLNEVNPSTIEALEDTTSTITCTDFNVNVNPIFFSEETISIFPNPFSNTIAITVQKEHMHTLSYTIRNLLGQTIFYYEEKADDNIYSTSVDLSFVSKGIYILELTIDGLRTTRKIAKQ
jgi:hypothetical protein